MTSSPAPSRHSAITGPGTPSRSPIAMTFLPLSIRPPLFLTIFDQKRAAVGELGHSAEKETSLGNKQRILDLVASQRIQRVPQVDNRRGNMSLRRSVA